MQQTYTLQIFIAGSRIPAFTGTITGNGNEASAAALIAMETAANESCRIRVHVNGPVEPANIGDAIEAPGGEPFGALPPLDPVLLRDCERRKGDFTGAPAIAAEAGRAWDVDARRTRDASDARGDEYENQ